MNRESLACFRTSAFVSIDFSRLGTGMVDRDLILRKIADIDLYLEQLRSYREVELDAYRADWKTQRIVERTLHLVIEVCMDVADHIVADRQLRVPDTGAATFDILAEAGVLARPLADSLGRMVGFRNILVHDYARLDPSLVLRAIRTDVRDVQEFRDAILNTVG
ncbi:MAG: DUF86 domain-containing protein [Luteitalea sp.]|nr:DUF86 domain-containing protein [Luteitalea sp.]